VLALLLWSETIGKRLVMAPNIVVETWLEEQLWVPLVPKLLPEHEADIVSVTAEVVPGQAVDIPTPRSRQLWDSLLLV